MEEVLEYRNKAITPASRISEFHYAIRDVVAAAAALEREGRNVIHLNIGDPQAFGFRPPEHVVDAVCRGMRARFTGYSHSAGLFEAREAVAEYATRCGAPTEPDEVILTSGASEAADLVLTALLEREDEVLLPAPGYPIYPAILSKLSAKPRYYKLDGATGWQPSPDEIVSMIGPKVKAIVLINPNNPTGSITRDPITRELLELASALNLVVISDEVYRDLCFEKPPTPASVLAKESGAAVITLESLSKTHMLSGWRIGWMRFTNSQNMTELISAISKLAGGRLCSPTPAQYAVKPALEMSAGYYREFLREIRLQRDFAVARVRSVDGLSCSVPEAAFYLFAKAACSGDLSDVKFVRMLLEETGILVVPGSGFGCDPNEGYFRIVYLPDRELLAQAFDRVENFIRAERTLRTI
jgi:alanine-synthesizing transaminase